jgi:tetratricopeptide (TPR) repeat protein
VLKKIRGSAKALPLLDEAQLTFEAIERDKPGGGAETMVSRCFSDRGDCLRALGRLDEAAAAYEESIRRAEKLGNDRGVAVGKGQIGAVRLNQRRYKEALAAYEEARERFTRLDEPGTVAGIWHQIGTVYQGAEQSEAAEDAYRKSLAIRVRLADGAGQADTLIQLGVLYYKAFNRPEEAAAFYRQAVDKYVEIGDEASEGRARNNLGDTLRKLRRLDEARQEIRRATECKEPLGHAGSIWKTWSILAGIETYAENPTAAAEAKRKAIECYLAYRRDGGENHNSGGRICLAVTQPLLAGDPAAGASLLQQVAADPDLPNDARTFIQAPQTIVAGSRDRGLADAPDLDYTMATETLFLLDKLEEAGK